MATQLATGTTLTFSSGFLANVENFDRLEMSREMIETTHFGTTGYRTYIPGSVTDPGGATVEMQHDGTVAPPINGAFETLTVLYPDGTGFSVSAALEGYSESAPLEGKIMATARLKFSGTITFDTTPT